MEGRSCLGGRGCARLEDQRAAVELLVVLWGAAFGCITQASSEECLDVVDGLERVRHACVEGEDNFGCAGIAGPVDDVEAGLGIGGGGAQAEGYSGLARGCVARQRKRQVRQHEAHEWHARLAPAQGRLEAQPVRAVVLARLYEVSVLRRQTRVLAR